MSFPRRLVSASCLCVLVLAIPVTADESPLAQVPAQSSIVIHVRGAARVKDRVLHLLKSALPNDVAREVTNRIEEVWMEGFNGRELHGLPADGPIFISYPGLPAPGQDTGAAFILRVADYKKFRNGLLKDAERKTLKKDPTGYETATLGTTDFYFIQRSGFAIVTPNKELAVQFTKPQAGIDTKFAGDTAKRFLGADLSVYVDMAAVNKTFGQQIKEMRAQLDQTLGQVMHFYANDKNSIELIKGLLDLVFQAIDDSRALMVNLNFRPEGAAIQAEVLFPKETKTGLMLTSFRPAPLKDMVKLPSGQMVYMGLHVESALLKRMPAGLFGASSSRDSERDQRIQEQINRLANSGPRARYTSARLPLEGMQIWDFENPKEAQDAFLTLARTLKAGDIFEGIMLKEQPRVRTNADKYRDVSWHQIQTVWDIDKLMTAALTAQTAPPEMLEATKQQMLDLMKKIAGDGRTMWIGIADKALLQVTAKDWPSAQRQIDQFLDGKGAIGTDPAFQAALRELPDKTSVALLMEAGSYASFLSEFMGGFAKAPAANTAKQPNDPISAEGRTSYLGVAVTLQPERCRLDVWVPAPAISAFYKAFEPILKAAATPEAISDPPAPVQQVKPVANAQRTSIDQETAKMQGAWKVASIEADGKKRQLEDDKGARMIIKGNRFFLSSDDETTGEGTFSIVEVNGKTRKADITFVNVEMLGKAFTLAKWLDDDTFLTCLNWEKRPSDFTSEKGQILMTFRRIKK